VLVIRIDELVRAIQTQATADERAALATLSPLVIVGSCRSKPIPRWRQARNGRGIVDTASEIHARDVFPAEGAHIVRHDPARVLADVAMKRAMLARLLAEPHGLVDDGDEPYPCPRRGTSAACQCGRDERVRGYLELMAGADETEAAG